MPNENSANNSQPASTQAAGQSKSRSKMLIAVVVLTVLIMSTVVGYLLTRQKSAFHEPGARVVINESGFNPGVIQIKKGQTVTWTNRDGKDHYVIGDTPNAEPTIGFDSGTNLSTGDTFTYKFEEAGTFTYNDKRNPINVQGTVTVVE